jgi:uncharacterized protein (TIGR02145 family)
MNKIIVPVFIFFSVVLSIFTSCQKNDGYTATTDSISSLPEITFNDVEGNLYHGVYIGSQIWSKENLRVSHYRDGTAITEVTDQALWNGMSDTMYLYCKYNNESYLGNQYGYLYNRNVVFNDTLQIAPQGWRIPTIADWDTLFAYLGGAAVASSKMREAGTSHWIGPNNSNNNSGFTALPGGYRSIFGFEHLSVKAKFWALWPYVAYGIDGSPAVLSDSTIDRQDAYSIRLIKSY